MNNLIIENIEIPILKEGILLKGSIYYSEETPSKAPFIVNLAGFRNHRESYLVKYYSERFSKAGYYVLSYDYRGHGETKKKPGAKWDDIMSNIFTDLHLVIDWILKTQTTKLLKNKLVLFGRSLGGAIILSKGFLDKRVTKIIALCTRFDYHTVSIKPSENTINVMSPRYYLKPESSNNSRILIAHCKDDKTVPFKNVNSIKEALNLREENVIVFDAGGHSFKGHREDILIKSLDFLKEL